MPPVIVVGAARVSSVTLTVCVLLVPGAPEEVEPIGLLGRRLPSLGPGSQIVVAATLRSGPDSPFLSPSLAFSLSHFVGTEKVRTLPTSLLGASAPSLRSAQRGDGDLPFLVLTRLCVHEPHAVSSLKPSVEVVPPAVELHFLADDDLGASTRPS